MKKGNIMRQTILAMMFLLAACSSYNEQGNAPGAVEDAEWTKHGLDDGEQRYSTLDAINVDNVSRLGLIWSFDMYTKRGVEATPLMVNRTLYVSGSWSMVYALDAVSGKLKWFYDPKVDKATLAKGCCDAVNRGVAYQNGKIFVGTYDGRLVALDEDSGDVIWEVVTVDQSQPYTITGAPRIARNNIIIGNGGAELGVRGYVTAYDLDTGKQQWRFYTVPGNPADGYENETMEMAAKTWTGEWWKWGGGGTVWDSMAYDPELDLLYIGVGNGSPWNASLRSPDGGDNLFLSSIVALKPDTGEYVWHYQTTPAETWDFTATQHIMLADLTIEGSERKVLMQAPKNGFFYVIDRATGELISAEKYTVANWASHIDLKTGRPVETEIARVFDGVTVHIPSNGGGHNWQPMAYNPKTGLVYLPTMVFPSAFKAPTREIDSKPKQGTYNTGFDRMSLVPPNVEGINDILDSQFQGELTAWDPVTQSLRWKTEPARIDGSGVLATAGNLVFKGIDHERFAAYHAETGELLWEQPTQTVASGTPMTYAIDGKQYVAIAVGFGGALGAEAGAISGHWNLVNRSRVLVYALGGIHQLPDIEEQPEREMVKPLPVTSDEETVAQGQVLYQRHCSFCHGDGLRSSGLVPDLRYSNSGIHRIWEQIVIDGILQSSGMVSFSKYLTPEDAESIRQYALSEANRLYSESLKQ
jgi:PQQ-dependent dehydrogenase (methanol/ethanol family)